MLMCESLCCFSWLVVAFKAADSQMVKMGKVLIIKAKIKLIVCHKCFEKFSSFGNNAFYFWLCILIFKPKIFH